MKELKRVLLVGCGQLGSRHLQALAKVPSIGRIEVVDPRPEGLRLGQERFQEALNGRPGPSVSWLPSLDRADPGGDLCIIATLARERTDLTREIVEGLGYSRFILEKLVASSIDAYRELIEYGRREGLSAWVNCAVRGYPVHQRIKQRISPREPIHFSVVGGNHGLATNGVHAADLFLFYTEAKEIHSAGSTVDPILHPSKRGTGLFDLSGTIRGVTDNGSEFTLTYAASHRAYEHFSIAAPNTRCLVDHIQQWWAESSEASAWAWRAGPITESLLVSHLTRLFVSDILSKGSCALPTLEEAFPAHAFILNELKPHFGRLLGKEVEECPVT